MADVRQRPDVGELVADLAAEQGDLDGLLEGISDDDWDLPTPAASWSVRDQVAHLAFFDAQGDLAIRDPDAFKATREDVALGEEAERARSLSVAELKSQWINARADLLCSAAELDPRARVPWFGPDMGGLSFVTARLMETWAHGQDVADGLGVGRLGTERLRHIADLGLRTRRWSYDLQRMAPAETAVRLELLAPDGETWVLGEEVADDLVRGSALDFCLVVTQRRHLADTDIVATGPHAVEWLAIAQCFAGPPGSGRRPGEFT